MAASFEVGTSSGAKQHNFALKADVYLSTCTVADGTWYFQVTDPNGSTVLSSDLLTTARTFTTSGGNISAYSGGHGTGTPTCGGAISIQLFPYDDTPNTGCVYKIWISQDQAFPTNNSDTKTFKTCNNGAVPTDSTLSGVKFYDGNRDDALDNGEAGIAGVTINITDTTDGSSTGSTTTDGAGGWSWVVDSGHTYTVCEDITAAPLNATLWEQTAPVLNDTSGTATANASRCWTGTAGDALIGNLNFGNVAKVIGTKYYDTNANGAPDGGEPVISGFKIQVCFDSDCPGTADATVYTGVSGNYSFYLPLQNSKYIVQETLPPTGNWFQTGPIPSAVVGNATATALKQWSNQSVGGPQGGLYFTNVCFVTPNGLFTLGYYKNAGNSTITGSDLATLDGLNLRNGDGTNFNPSTTPATGRTQVKNWLAGATATNMAYMLSVQLAVMQLNVDHGFNPNVFIYAPGTNSANSAGFALLSDVMNEANTLLGSEGTILAGNPDRTRAGALETALDNANNARNIVGGPGQCAAPTPGY